MASSSSVSCICASCREKRVIRRRADEILNILMPTVEAERTRRAALDWTIAKVVREADDAVLVCPVGSYALKTYLPNSDIDIVVVLNTNRKRRSTSEDTVTKGNAAVSEEVKDPDFFARLCASAAKVSDDASHALRSVQFVRGDVKVTRVAVNNIFIDVSSSSGGGSLRAVDFFEQLDAKIGRSHLFKKSVLLIKAWIRYEHPSIGGARDGGLSTHAINTMVASVFSTFGPYLEHPLDVLAHFSSHFSDFDWDRRRVTCDGSEAVDPTKKRCVLDVLDPVDISKSNNCARAMTAKKAMLFVDALKRCRMDVQSVVTFEPCETMAANSVRGGRKRSGDGGRGGGGCGRKKKKSKRVLDVTQKLHILDSKLFPGTWSALTHKRDGSAIVPWRPDLLRHPMQRWTPPHKTTLLTTLAMGDKDCTSLRKAIQHAKVSGKSSGTTDPSHSTRRRRRRRSKYTIFAAILFVVAAISFVALVLVNDRTRKEETIVASFVAKSIEDVASCPKNEGDENESASEVVVWIPNDVAVGVEQGDEMQLVRGNFRYRAASNVILRNLPPPPTRRVRSKDDVQFVRTHLESRVVLDALPSNGAVEVGSTLTVFRWFRNGLLLSHESARALIVDSVSPSDLGTYLCRVSNPLWAGGDVKLVKEWVLMVDE